jgi:hypothetical protein
MRRRKWSSDLQQAIGRSIDLIIPEDLRAAHWRGYHQAITVGKTKSGGRAMATRAAHKHGGKLYVELAFGIVSVSPRETEPVRAPKLSCIPHLVSPYQPSA